MKGLLIDTKTNGIRIMEESSLKDWYEVIDCRCIDIIRRSVGGVTFEIVIDDEGWLIDKPIVSAFTKQGTPTLAGTLVFYGGVDTEGNLKEITTNGVKAILKSIASYVDSDGNPRIGVVIDD